MVEIWWDKSVETMQQVEVNRPDVVVVDHGKKKWLIVDFCALRYECDCQGRRKNIEVLAHQVRRLHRVSTSVVPVVVGCLGVVTKRLEKGLKELGIPDVLGGLQTSAIIETTNILRKVFSL